MAGKYTRQVQQCQLITSTCNGIDWLVCECLSDFSSYMLPPASNVEDR